MGKFVAGIFLFLLLVFMVSGVFASKFKKRMDTPEEENAKDET